MFSSVNTCWTLVGAFLVYFMQAGFALCEAGFTRAKNTGNILMKNMMDFCIGTPCYWLIGFGLMFGGTGALIGGFDPFIQGDYSHLGLDIPLWDIPPAPAIRRGPICPVSWRERWRPVPQLPPEGCRLLPSPISRGTSLRLFGRQTAFIG